jgi:hypothetical protein
MTDDDKLARAYRALAKEEPPAALDAKVLDAARRAARPSLSRRWGVPVSIAAVLVLATGLVLEMRSQRPGIETSPGSANAPAEMRPQEPRDELSPEATTARPKARKAEEALREQKKSPNADVPAPQSPPRRSAAPIEQPPQAPEAEVAPAPRRDFAPTPKEELAPKQKLEFAPTPKPELAPAPHAAPEAPARTRAAPAPSAGAAPAAASAVPAAPPAPAAAQPPRAAPQPESNVSRERAPLATDATASGRLEKRAAAKDDAANELEAIAKLRAEGRDEEADRALEEFRARHPGYVIPEATLRRVQPR